ncbi:hypothetical protein BH10ACT3_BH10ACT3_10110 [soil metagenome]
MSDDVDGSLPGEPDITGILTSLADDRVTAGPGRYAAVLHRVNALEPEPVSHANLPGLVLIELTVEPPAAATVATALLEVAEAVTGTTISVLAWADVHGQVDITSIDQSLDLTVGSSTQPLPVLVLEARGVFAQLMQADPVQLALTMHWFLDRPERLVREPRPASMVRSQYSEFATGLRRVVEHATDAGQAVLLDIGFRSEGVRRVGLKTSVPAPPEKQQRQKRFRKP